jgi:hypothetical protein
MINKLGARARYLALPKPLSQGAAIRRRIAEPSLSLGARVQSRPLLASNLKPSHIVGRDSLFVVTHFFDSRFAGDMASAARLKLAACWSW